MRCVRCEREGEEGRTDSGVLDCERDFGRVGECEDGLDVAGECHIDLYHIKCQLMIIQRDRGRRT